MSTILNFVRDYFIFMLALFLFSYLAPKENYRKYFQFFIGVLMVAILMRPVLTLFSEDGEEEIREKVAQVEEHLEDMEFYGEGEDIFEQFLEAASVDTEADGGT